MRCLRNRIRYLYSNGFMAYSAEYMQEKTSVIHLYKGVF